MSKNKSDPRARVTRAAGSHENAEVIQWADDPKAEAILRGRDLTWHVQRIPVDEIDFDASTANQGRITEKISDDRVTEYAMAMIDGEVFPRPVLNKMVEGRYYILSGNHRCRGAREAAAPDVEAYVIKTVDALVIDFLPMLFNLSHGVNVSTEARYEQARRMVAQYKLDRKVVASAYRISYGGFCDFLRGLEAIDRLHRINIDGTKMPRLVQCKLNTIANSNSFAAVGQLISSAGMETDRAIQLIDAVRSAPNEMEALQEVIRVRDQLATERRTDRPANTPPVPIRDRLFRQVHALLNSLTKHKTGKACQITTPGDQAAINGKIKQIVERATVLFGYPGGDTRSPAAGNNQSPDPEPGGQGGVPGAPAPAPRGRRTSHVR